MACDMHFFGDMKFLDALLARFGYVKLEDYGLTLSASGQVVPLPDMAVVAPGWQSRDGHALPLPAGPEAPLPPAPDRPPAVPRALAPAQTAEPPFDLWRAPAPPPARAARPTAAVPPPLPATASAPPPPAAAPAVNNAAGPAVDEHPDEVDTTEREADESHEWEWRMAAARARARNDATATVPQGAQAAAATRAPARRPSTGGEMSEDEWEWRVATARAKARNDDTALIPQGDQAAGLAGATRRRRPPTAAERVAAVKAQQPEPLFPSLARPAARRARDRDEPAARRVAAPAPRLADGSTPNRTSNARRVGGAAPSTSPRPVRRVDGAAPTNRTKKAARRIADGSGRLKPPGMAPAPRRSVAMVTPPTMRKGASRSAGRSVAMVTPPTMRKGPPARRRPGPSPSRPGALAPSARGLGQVAAPPRGDWADDSDTKIDT